MLAIPEHCKHASIFLSIDDLTLKPSQGRVAVDVSRGPPWRATKFRPDSRRLIVAVVPLGRLRVVLCCVRSCGGLRAQPRSPTLRSPAGDSLRDLLERRPYRARRAPLRGSRLPPPGSSLRKDHPRGGPEPASTLRQRRRKGPQPVAAGRPSNQRIECRAPGSGARRSAVTRYDPDPPAFLKRTPPLPDERGPTGAGDKASPRDSSGNERATRPGTSVLRDPPSGAPNQSPRTSSSRSA